MGTIDRPMSEGMQRALDSLNETVALAAEDFSLNSHEMLMVLVALVAMYAAAANDAYMETPGPFDPT